MKITLENKDFHFKLLNEEFGSYHFNINGKKKSIRVQKSGRYFFELEVNKNYYPVYFSKVKNSIHLVVEGKDYFINLSDSERKTEKTDGLLMSPMPGKILKIFVKEGQNVQEGESLLIMEAMKMEHTLKAPKDGTVSKITVKEGEQVVGDLQLVHFEKA